MCMTADCRDKTDKIEHVKTNSASLKIERLIAIGNKDKNGDAGLAGHAQVTNIFDAYIVNKFNVEVHGSVCTMLLSNYVHTIPIAK